MKYIAVEWPEIQDYMMRADYSEKSYFDPIKNTWLIPEDWLDEELDEEPEFGTVEFFNLHDCWDAIGGDWEG